MGSRYDLSILDYVQQCKSFETANEIIWNIHCHINCNSNNVIYYLKCPTCYLTSTEQTNNLRLRMNGHRSNSRLENNTNIIDRHIFQCVKRAQSESEPMFLIYTFLTVGYERILSTYEDHLHDITQWAHEESATSPRRCRFVEFSSLLRRRYVVMLHLYNVAKRLDRLIAVTYTRRMDGIFHSGHYW